VAEYVRLDVDGRGIAWITLARPDVRNAFDAQLVAELTETLAKLDLAARAVVLRAEGDAFCAGADLNWMRRIANHTLEENVADARALAHMFRHLDELSMPLLARVQGPAIGGGAGLVAVCDIAIASTAASFAFTEVRLGIVPAVVSPYVVRKIGFAHATALFTTGQRFDAQRAREIGLVEDVVSPEGLDERLATALEAILAAGPRAVNAAKRLVREIAGRHPSDVRDLTIERIAAIRVSPEGQEGMRAFLERRPPKW